MSAYPRPVPLAWYFDPEVQADVQSEFFSSNYFGNIAMVPQTGDYLALSHYEYEELLVHADDGFRRLSNRCRHKRSMIVDPIHRKDQPRGNVGPTKKIMCPVHCWAYELNGKNAHTPFFDTLREEVSHGGPAEAGLRHPIDLPSEKLREWNGLLFSGDRDIAAEMKNLGHSGLFDPSLLDFSQYSFVDLERTDYDFNWLVFMDVYFDLYHVAPYHKRTFNQLVDTTSMEWEFGKSYSVQVTKFREAHQGVSAAYGYVRTLIEEFWKGEQPPHGALWFSLYPNLMIEWYPLMMVVSHIVPTGPMSCRNIVEYYVPKKWERRMVDIFRAQQAAYNETALEDGEICLTMSEGYHRDFLQKIDERGPDHPHLELGIVEFHNWLRARAGARLSALDVR